MNIDFIENKNYFLFELKDKNNKLFAIFTKKGLGNFSYSNKNFDKDITVKNIKNFCVEFNDYFRDKLIIGVKLQHKDNFFFFENILKESRNQKLENNICQKISDNYFFLNNEYDAIGSIDKKISPLITYADCIPAALFDVENKIFFSIHSGWKTTVYNIIKEIVDFLLFTIKSKKENIKIIVGPSIFGQFYEFNKDDFEKFFFNEVFQDKIKQKFKRSVNDEMIKEINYRKDFILNNFFIYKNSKTYFDFRNLFLNDIKKEGIEVIYNIERDTFTDGELSSYRRDKENFVAQGLFTGIVKWK